MANHIYVRVTTCYTASSYYGLIFVEACNMLFISPQYLHSYIAYIPSQLQYVLNLSLVDSIDHGIIDCKVNLEVFLVRPCKFHFARLIPVQLLQYW